jgi:hypothetical protein
VKNIGKPCAVEPHAQFDEGGMVEAVIVGIMRHRRTKGAETDRSSLKPHNPSLYSTFLVPSTVGWEKLRIREPAGYKIKGGNVPEKRPVAENKEATGTSFPLTPMQVVCTMVTH